MSNNRFAFDSYFDWPTGAKIQHMIFADGSSKAKIHGIGTILFSFNDFILRLQILFFVPSLSTSLFSIKAHAQYRFFLTFPTYTIKKSIGNDLSLTAKLLHTKSTRPHFDSTKVPLSHLSSHSSHDSLKHTLTAFCSKSPHHSTLLQHPSNDSNSELISISSLGPENTNCGRCDR